MTAAWKVSVHMTALIPPCKKNDRNYFRLPSFPIRSFSHGGRVKDAHDEDDHAGDIHVYSGH